MRLIKLLQVKVRREDKSCCLGRNKKSTRSLDRLVSLLDLGGIA